MFPPERIFPPSNDSRLDSAIQTWRKFEEGLKSTDRIGVVYHGDMDGLIGGTYVRRALLDRNRQGTHDIATFWVKTEEYDFASLRNWINDQKLDKCVFTDISLENHPATLDFVARNVRDQSFIFDHHILNANVADYPNVMLVNPTPHKLDDDQHAVPTFLFSYRLAIEKRLVFPEWLLVLCIFSEGVDSFFEKEVQDLLRINFQVSEEQPVRAAYKSTVLPKISSLVRASFSGSVKSDVPLKLMDSVATGEIKTPEQLETKLSPLFQLAAKNIAKGISNLVEKWKYELKRNPQGGPIVLIPIDGPNSVAGPVASILRGYFPDKVIVTYVKVIGKVVVELRTNNSTHLNLAAILGRVSNNVNLINYGGHPMAAGALIDESVSDGFFANLTTEILKDL
ncbi:MAG TPA: DHH family phosphoesterase [Pirellulaceae bacterium]|nr:DHH family phosphoesterase [Pyrinomonadaceae bacterium]HMP65580.1 DHH family phosphoesterase [Pyrinomonadaceae bacterium]HMP70715.1 DHH family phosphoesterase [Pirellulaceae bacterium]